MKLLIVDDNQSLCEMYTILFENSGYEVRSCYNGMDALTAVVEYAPDVVLLDIMMPTMNGHEFLAALGRNTSMDPVIIVFSNIGEQVEIDRALAHGADAFLQKSDHTGAELIEAVGNAYTTAMQKRLPSS